LDSKPPYHSSQIKPGFFSFFQYVLLWVNEGRKWNWWAWTYCSSMAPTTVGKKYSFAIIYIYIYIYIYISCLMDVTACSFSITEECMLPVWCVYSKRWMTCSLGHFMVADISSSLSSICSYILHINIFYIHTHTHVCFFFFFLELDME